MELGWIDFSKSEREKVLNALNALGEQEALDELGISPARDGFSDLFFPGTSTLQRRAKYFLIVPYAMRDLELADETGTNTLTKLLSRIENECAKQFLRANANEEGVIGSNSVNNGTWVKRAPSELYWAGLRRYGIFRDGRYSIAEYLQALSVRKRNRKELNNMGNRNDNAEEQERDDDFAGSPGYFQFWNIPAYDREWFDKLNMKLTPEEGKFLKERIVSSCPLSLYAYILKNNMREILDIPSFMDLKVLIDRFPKEIQEQYDLAYRFSRFVFALRVVYNLIVSAEKNETAVHLMADIHENLADYVDIDISAIISTLGLWKNPDFRDFLEGSRSALAEWDIGKLENLIRNREIRLKGENRAKTCKPGQFGDDAWFGGGELDYRFTRAKMIIRDIFMSEGVV